MLIDLSLVTTTMLRLLQFRVDALWATFFPPLSAPPITYSGVESALLTDENALGFFLYHLGEDPHFKNQPPYYPDQPAVRFTPMGLQLQYQLVAHTSDMAGSNPNLTALRSQKLFGLALKTLHDYPSIDRDTKIAGTTVFPPELDKTDNVLRVTLRSVTANEATNFWTAGTQGIRLAAYYEVNTVLLEPDRPQAFGGRVLRYGVHIFVNGAPRLDASRSTVVFRIPGEMLDRTAEVQPGEAASGENLKLEGVDLNGDVTTLLINRAGWKTPEEVGIDWGVVAGADVIAAQVRDRAGGRDVVPGVYTAAARVTRNRRMPDGSMRAFSQTSNEVPFTVAPSVTTPAHNVVATAVGNVVTVTGGRFQHPDIAKENVRVTVGAVSIPLQPSGPLTAGHFEVSATQLKFQFPIAGLTPGDVLPLRIIVNGAENAPRWVRVP